MAAIREYKKEDGSVIYHAEDQAKRRKAMTMMEWEQKLDTFLAFNERDLLEHAGKVCVQVDEKLALDHYEKFEKK